MGKQENTRMAGFQIPEGTTVVDTDEYDVIEQKRRDVQRRLQEKQMEQFEGFSIPLPVLMQSVILVATLHASYNLYGAEPFQLIWKLIVFIGAQLVRRLTNKQKKLIEDTSKDEEGKLSKPSKPSKPGKNHKNKKEVPPVETTNPVEKVKPSNSGFKFEVIYVFFLPFMLSLLFYPELITINTVLMLNVFDGSLLTRSVIQMFFLMFTSQDELVLLRNFSAIVLNVTFHYVLSTVSELKSLDNVDCNLFSMLLTNVLFLAKKPLLEGEPVNLPYNVLWGTLMALLASLGINYMVSLLLAITKNKYVRSICLFTTFVISFPLLANYIIDVGDKTQSPVMWLLNYITESKTRRNILITWLSFLFILIPNILIFKSNFSLNTSRKLWHFLILALIIQPFQLDPTFVKISLAGTITLFLAVEYLRFLKLEPLGSLLDEKLRSFADFRDERGPIIISYIYLIIGISAPLLIANSPVGLISLGVGDSSASIIGKKYGELHWPTSKKTIEGTMAFITTTFVVGVICKEYLGYFAHLNHASWLLVCTLSGILEGNSILNDNILIPAFMLICEKLFTPQVN